MVFRGIDKKSYKLSIFSRNINNVIINVKKHLQVPLITVMKHERAVYYIIRDQKTFSFFNEQNVV